MNELELKQAVKAEYRANFSSPQVEEKLRQTYENLPDLPQQRKRPALRVLRTAGAALGSLAAAFMLLVGISAASPALAAAIPGMESIVSFLKGSGRGDPLLQAGAIPQYAQPVASTTNEESPGLQITESYFDGQVLLLGTKLTLDDAPEGDLLLYPEYQVSFSDGEKKLSTDYETDYFSKTMERISGNTFAGTLTLYPVETGGDDVFLDLPDSFQITVGMKSLSAMDLCLMVPRDDAGDGPYYPADYDNKRYTLETPEAFTCSVSKDDSLKKVYPVHETKEGCTLDQITVTPAWTEVKLTLSEERENAADPVILRLYDGKGEKLTSVYEMGAYYSSFARQRFQTPVKDETSLTVKLFLKSDARTPIAEFTVPIEGGFDRPGDARSVDGQVKELVYDPPCVEVNPSDIPVDPSIAQQLELNKPITLKGGYQALEAGSIDMTLSNPRYYSDWREAGIADEDMNLPMAMQELDPQAMEEKLDDMSFVMLDVTLSADPETRQLSGLENYWITSFVDCMVTPTDRLLQGMAAANTPDAIMVSLWSDEIQYFSEHGIGFSDYYHFYLDPGETKTVQVGFLVSTEELEAGHMQIFGSTSITNPYADQETSPEPPDQHYYYFTVPAPDQQ